jgi:DMSO/TMAO reductase YedYZ molybdopterin-dependent catalytic subunit
VEAGISQNELALAARNHGMPLEALRYPITPVGLHYLLVHYDIPDVDAEAWSLSVDGRVGGSLDLSLADLRDRPAHEVTATMECAGNGRALLAPHVVSQPWLLEAIGTARWRGARLTDVLQEAGLLDDAVEVVFTGLDRGVEKDVEQNYQRSLALDDALGDDVLLAYEMNGAPLLPQHGFPLRLLVPGWYGMTSVKWLTRVEVVAEPFEGYQMTAGYRFRVDEDDEGRPVTRMQPRALMVPPGIPDFDTRARIVETGPRVLEGRAWSGWAPVTRVEVSADGGQTWADAELEDLGSRWAWRGWRYEWNAQEPGEYVLCCRAADEAGNVQPNDPTWNVGGYSNNALQRVPVTVQ